MANTEIPSNSQSNSGNVINHIHIEELEDCNNQELANIINQAFLEPLEEYRLEQPLTKFPAPTDSPKLHEVSELRIMKLLATLNPSKACGPDEIPNWLLKEYAELLAFPVSKIINSSFKEQRLPKIWKFADVSPLPKVKPVEDLKKHLRPISLTPCLSKVAEELACENIHFSSLFVDGDVSRGGTLSATQRQKFHTDDVKSVRNPVRSADWSDRVVTLSELLFTNGLVVDV